ncbi:unnamed protein product [Linum trigynum]|uniref:Uncharacterized protein n=1 Tax=Linum trigynum TaxID=586398 RepID=A0AAV2CY70_9ROSI
MFSIKGGENYQGSPPDLSFATGRESNMYPDQISLHAPPLVRIWYLSIDMEEETQSKSIKEDPRSILPAVLLGSQTYASLPRSILLYLSRNPRLRSTCWLSL